MRATDQSKVKLCEIVVNNVHDESHTVSVELERNEEVVYQETRDVGAISGNRAGGFVAEEVWTDDPAGFVLRWSVDGEEVNERDLTRIYDGEPESVSLQISINRDGSSGLYIAVNQC